MNKILDNILAWIKQNKKIAIIAGVAIVMLLIILVVGGKKGQTSDFLGTVNTLHSSVYTADGTIDISDKGLTVNINKSDTGFVINASCGDNDYSNIISKIDGAIYLNDEAVEAQGGLLTISTSENDDAKNIYDVLYEAISECKNITYETDGDTQKMIINTTEGWAEFWQTIYNALDVNTDAIAAGYSTPDAVKTQIKTYMADIKKLAETNTIANTLEVDITPAEGSYTVHFDMTMDMSMLPSFAKADDIDSNKLKLSGNIIFTITDAVTIKKPSGAVHAMTPTGIDGFMSAFWNSMFEKGAYISFNQVSVTNDSVSLTRKLGETTEVCQLVFNTDGVTNAVWYITSPNEGIIDAYVDKYKTSDSTGNTSEQDNFLKTELDDGTFSLTISVSDTGLTSFNKIAKTPKAMGEYLNTAKGGDIIV